MLIFAVRKGDHSDALTALIAHGQGMGVEGLLSPPLLHEAAMHQRIECVQVLLKHGVVS